TEDDSLDSNPPKEMRRTLEAIRHLENAVLRSSGIAGIVLRYGSFYGVHRSVRTAKCWSWFVNAGSPSLATAEASGRSYTSMTPPKQHGLRLKEAHRGSSILWTMIQKKCLCGFPNWHRRLEPGRLIGCRHGSDDSWSVLRV